MIEKVYLKKRISKKYSKMLLISETDANHYVIQKTDFFLETYLRKNGLVVVGTVQYHISTTLIEWNKCRHFRGIIQIWNCRFGLDGEWFSSTHIVFQPEGSEDTAVAATKRSQGDYESSGLCKVTHHSEPEFSEIPENATFLPYMK